MLFPSLIYKRLLNLHFQPSLYDVTSGLDKINLYIVQIFCKDTQQEQNTLDDFQVFVFKLISIGQTHLHTNDGIRRPFLLFSLYLRGTLPKMLE